MKTLAIDTSHPAGSVAAGTGPAFAIRPLGEAAGHARRLAAALAEAAAEAGWPVAAAELVVVVRGPGSFTGLRVGVATAKAVAWAGGGRLVGVSGFEIVARETARLAGTAAEPVAIGFDAGRGEVFAARATPEPGRPSGWLVGPPELLATAAWIAGLPPDSLVSGPAVALHAASLAAAGKRLAPPEARAPSAAAAAALGLALAAAGQADDPAALVPDYLRPSYADERAG